jgi:hypothetical protein
MTRREMIDWLVEWRQTMKGSISPQNHRRILETRTNKELERMIKRIVEVHQFFNGGRE